MYELYGKILYAVCVERIMCEPCSCFVLKTVEILMKFGTGG